MSEPASYLRDVRVNELTLCSPFFQKTLSQVEIKKSISFVDTKNGLLLLLLYIFLIFLQSRK